MPATSTLTKRIEFSASHRYFRDEWDDEKNRKVFGPCVREHGHNYLLEVTLQGRVDATTGMIINLYDLKTIVTEVLEEFDHKHLNLDTPYFVESIPTTENLALVLWKKFRDRSETQDVSKIRLFEGEDLWADIHATPGALEPPTEASVTRCYPFSLVTREMKHPKPLNFHFSVTVRGPIDPMTGRVTDIVALDSLVAQHVLNPFSDKDWSRISSHFPSSFSSSWFLQHVWPSLLHVSGGRLHQLTLKDQNHTVVEYHG